MLGSIVLYRDCSELYPNEKDAIEANFICETSRMKIGENKLVIGRYAVLPFYKELEDDLALINSKLINSYSQHQYVANLQNWFDDFKLITPHTWFRLEDIPDKGPFVIKGLTNSRKNLWKSHMFAENKKEAIEVASRLYDDSLISQQGICVREYIPLVNFGYDLGGAPIAEEYRFFFLDGEVLCGAFYWSSHIGMIKEKYGSIPSASVVPKNMLNKIGIILRNKIRFAVADIAKTQDGSWILIELNDAQMSGLSENDPQELYKRMKEVLYDNR
jgi:ATP-grasp domain, R2K clade family 3